MFPRFYGKIGKSPKKLFLAVTLTLLLTSSLPLLAFQSFAQADLASIFSDGFESGSLGTWKTASTSSGVTAQVQSQTVYNGVYALKVAVVNGAGESGICISKDLGASYTSICAQTYIMLTAKPSVGTNLEVFGFSSDGWIPNAVGARVDITNVGGTLQWRLNYQNSGWQDSYVGQVELNTWYCLEIKLVLGRGNGETRLYVDGNELIAKTALTNTATGSSVRYLSLGVDDEKGGNTFNAFFDLVLASNSYIGPHQTPEPSPTPTPSPSPTATPPPTPSPTPTSTPEPTAPPTPTPIATPNPTPTPTPTPTPKPTPTATPTPSPKPTATPTPTPTPTTTPTPTPTPTATLTPQPTPTPTSTPVYKETPTTKPIQASWIANDGTLYAGDNNRLYKSLDHGKTWQQLKQFSQDALIICVYINTDGYIFTSAVYTSDANSLGLYRSVDDGATWSRVINLQADRSIISIVEDTNGNLYAGVYTMGYVADARIYKSTDGGATWSSVYYDVNARHVHCMEVDESNNYLYASIGDVRVDPAWTCYVMRSTDGGQTWSKIMSLPQILAIEAVTKTDAQGRLVSVARLFSTDYDNGQIYRTTDDATFSLVFDSGAQCYGFWIRTNNLNGDIYASFKTSEHPTVWTAGIWLSTDYGITWQPYRTFDVHSGYCGSDSASNFQNGYMYYDAVLDDGWQNAYLIYPDYTAQAQTFLGLDVLLGLNTVWLCLSTMAAVAVATLVLVKKPRLKLSRLL